MSKKPFVSWRGAFFFRLFIGVEAATHSFDFDRPRQGPHCLQIQQGDSVRFYWDEYHNLKELTSESNYNSCNFAGGAVLQSAGSPNPGGITVGPFDTTGDRFYGCSKICSSNGHKVRVCVGTDFTGDAFSGIRTTLPAIVLLVLTVIFV